jgi:hypothetical protein
MREIIMTPNWTPTIIFLAIVLIVLAVSAHGEPLSDEFADVWQQQFRQCRQLAPEFDLAKPGFCEAQADSYLKRIPRASAGRGQEP